MTEDDPFEQLKREIGGVALAWNGVVYELFRMFRAATNLPEPLADAIFFAIPSDKTQRSMLADVIAAALAGRDPDLLNSLRKVLGRLDKLSAERNAAMHVAWGIAIYENERGELVVGGAAPMPRARSWRGLKPEQVHQFRILTEQIDAVAGELGKLLKALTAVLTAAPTSLPATPSRQS